MVSSVSFAKVSATCTSAGLLPVPRNDPAARSSCAIVSALFCLLFRLTSALCSPVVSKLKVPFDSRTVLTSLPHRT